MNNIPAQIKKMTASTRPTNQPMPCCEPINAGTNISATKPKAMSTHVQM